MERESGKNACLRRKDWIQIPDFSRGFFGPWGNRQARTGNWITKSLNRKTYTTMESRNASGGLICRKLADHGLTKLAVNTSCFGFQGKCSTAASLPPTVL